MDAEDAAHYGAILDLENYWKTIVTTLNLQISLTTDILENCYEILIKINQQVITIGNNKIRSELNKFYFLTQLLNRNS